MSANIALDTMSQSVLRPVSSSSPHSTFSAARRFSLRGTHERAPVGILERSHATAWRNDIGDSGRAISRDERVAMALAQSHENLAEAAGRFEESQARSNHLLGGLRAWLDRFTGTARPEDINPIAAMLPEPGVEGEVVALMTDCQVRSEGFSSGGIELLHRNFGTDVSGGRLSRSFFVSGDWAKEGSNTSGGTL